MAERAELERDDADLAAWAVARRLLMRRPELVANDADLLASLGLKPAPANVVEFLPAALARVEAERARETDARQAIEGVAKANFAAQAQTGAAVLDLLEARNNADLARRADEAARARFGLLAAVLAAEAPDPVPLGWRDLPPGGVADLLGARRDARLGPPAAPELLFGDAAPQVGSTALIRMRLWDDRPGLLAFASPDPEGFTPDMGAELIAHLARVIERVAGRWPVL